MLELILVRVAANCNHANRFSSGASAVCSLIDSYGVLVRTVSKIFGMVSSASNALFISTLASIRVGTLQLRAFIGVVVLATFVTYYILLFLVGRRSTMLETS